MTNFIPPPHPCVVCNRAGGHISFRAPGLKGKEGPATVNFCSFECSETFMMARVAKIELTRDEDAAAVAGGKAAGAYLEKIGKTDLAAMTKDEWEEFCRTLVSGAYADLQKQADEAIPF